MSPSYDSNIKTKTITSEPSFDWSALIIWIVSLIISMIPIYIAMLKYLTANNQLDFNFLKQCFMEDDIIWVFATVLLFALANSISKHLNKKKKTPNWIKCVMPLGIVVFAIMETTWVVFKYVLNVPVTASWPVWLGIIFIVISLIISTPLQIDFIKEDD